MTLALYCPSKAWGGLEMVVARFAGWMQSRGHKVFVFGLKDSELLKNLPRGVTGIEVKKATRLPVLAGWRLSRFCKQRGIRQLIATTSPSTFVVSMAGRYNRELSAWYWQHMQIGHPKKDFLHTWFYQGLDGWIALMPWLKQEVEMTTRMPPEKIHVLPLGMEMKPFSGKGRTKAEARKKLGLPVDKIIIGMIGRLDPNKKQGLLLEAFAGLPPQLLRNSVIVFVGAPTIGHSEGYPHELRSLTGQLGLDDQMILLPFQSEVAEVYAALDFLVMATHSETYGLVTIEAMAAGVPVIGAAGGSTVQLLNPHWQEWPYDIVSVTEFRNSGYLEVQGGVLFRPDDSRSLQAALSFAFANRKRLQKKAVEIAPKIQQQFSHEKMLTELERLLKTDFQPKDSTKK